MSVGVKKERAARVRPWEPQWAPRDNARLLAIKVEIRHSVMTWLTPERTHVFDAFAGSGEMYRQVWREAASYVGCDEKWHNDDRLCFVGDNHRVLRAIDLTPFTCFDLDAYGSPWDQFGIIAARRPLQPGERFGLVLTEGTWLKTRAKDPVRGLRGALPRKLVTPIPYSVHDALIARTLRSLVASMGGRIANTWIAIGETGAKVRYVGLVLESLVAPPKSGAKNAPNPTA
jgi:hypothetical protein